MTVRFKCQSEYQKSYGVSRCRSVSPQRRAPSAGLRSDQMGISREPGLQRRKRLDPGGLARSCGSLLGEPDSKPSPRGSRTTPPAASRSRSAHRKDTKPPRTQADPETPPGPRPAADQGPAAGPPPSEEPGAAGESAESSKTDGRPQLIPPVTAAPDRQQPSANEVQPAARWRAGLRSGHRSEYHRQFSWKKPAPAASPILTAEQVLHSSSRSVPRFKKNPVGMETEYRRSFKGLVPPTEPQLRKHLEHQRVPLFHTHMTKLKRKEESEKKPRPKNHAPISQAEDATPTPQDPRGRRSHRQQRPSAPREANVKIPARPGKMSVQGLGKDIPKDSPSVFSVKELRQQASSYRRRAWGTNFSRDHLSQLVSEHNALWEPTDTPTTFDLCRSTPRVEALDLHSRSSLSSRRSSVLGSGEQNQHTNKTTHTACEEEEEEEDDTEEEEGRLPTPRLLMLPVQRTHHDLTTPATGGALLVGKLKSSDDSFPSKERCGSAVSVAAGTAPAVSRKEAWSENNPAHVPSGGPTPVHTPAASPPSKPIRMASSSPVAPPPHCIQGSLRHADFQHNGELGLRFRELQCSGGGCGSEEDDRLSVMSWRSAASCSLASAVLERAQKRREDFWGKR